jgi:hypothetical protein
MREHWHYRYPELIPQTTPGADVVMQSGKRISQENVYLNQGDWTTVYRPGFVRGEVGMGIGARIDRKFTWRVGEEEEGRRLRVTFGGAAKVECFLR